MKRPPRAGLFASRHLLPTPLALLLAAVAVPLSAQPPATAPPAEEIAEESASVAPGINENFLDPELDVEEWVNRFEVESREVYQARDEVMRRLRLQPGERIADVGAGTGFYSLLMADAVGPSGWVYAVELSPKFATHLSRQFGDRGVEHASVVLCQEDSVTLPPESIDAAFICDVYHHFEYPASTMGSLIKAMKPGGRLYVIDFERIPGVSREWTLSHVRAGKETFADEIKAAGFELTAERDIPGFEENYFLEFTKPAS